MFTTINTTTWNRKVTGLKRHCSQLSYRVFAPLHALEWRLKVQAHKPLIDGERFAVRLANNALDIYEAQKLRHEIFMVEQGHGSPGEDSGLDHDEYDDTSLHLLVEEKSTSRIVGTYRVRPGHLVRNSPGWYSERQYSISGLAEIERELCEVGRSCVDPEFRGGSVVALLWAGLLEMMRRTGCRYMIGCASLEVKDEALGWALYRKFRQDGKVSARVGAFPKDGFQLPHPDAQPEFTERELKNAMPPLLKGYFRLGAEIGGLPSFDPEFGSIDFLIILDVQKMNKRYMNHFLG